MSSIREIALAKAIGGSGGGGDITVEPLTVTENGTTVAPAGKAYSPVNVEVSGAAVNLYTNNYMPGAQITDVSGFTKLYNTSVSFGYNGTRVAEALGLTDETTIESYMSQGWNNSHSANYTAENQVGAYGGYSWASPMRLGAVKLYLGRYSGQNISLMVAVEYLDANGTWQSIKTLDIGPTLPYPLNHFLVAIPDVDIYGIRWIHTTPNKSSSNNLTFFGMTLYAQGQTQVYIPVGTGLIEPPAGYDGFGPLYID